MAHNRLRRELEQRIQEDGGYRYDLDGSPARLVPCLLLARALMALGGPVEDIHPEILRDVDPAGEFEVVGVSTPETAASPGLDQTMPGGNDIYPNHNSRFGNVAPVDTLDV